ncbi:MAG: ATP-binding cassette domain-containing protein [Paludibacteraceae bacterium]|nr:ATP-binding cassette domain-containing protein [Paludibacteraceae bacterium]
MRLTINNVCKSYKDKVALENVSIQLEGGSTLGLLGPNGAGKTTLIRAITGITQIDQGEILLDGTPISNESRRRIGYLPEERGLYPEMKVGEQLLYLAQLKGMQKESAKEAIKNWMRKFQISGTMEKRTNELSKGMQQKVQFIAAVIHSPQLLILDEPFSGFDPINAALIMNEILSLKEQGVGIILSTHNMTSVEEICDSVALINHAQIILEGKTAQIREANKTGKFLVKIAANVDFESGETLSSHFTKQENGFWLVEKKGKAKVDNNTLIRELTEIFSIVSFEEAQPSMNEIFLKAVNNH